MIRACRHVKWLLHVPMALHPVAGVRCAECVAFDRPARAWLPRFALVAWRASRPGVLVRAAVLGMTPDGAADVPLAAVRAALRWTAGWEPSAREILETPGVAARVDGDKVRLRLAA